MNVNLSHLAYQIEDHRVCLERMKNDAPEMPEGSPGNTFRLLPHPILEELNGEMAHIYRIWFPTNDGTFICTDSAEGSILEVEHFDASHY